MPAIHRRIALVAALAWLGGAAPAVRAAAGATAAEVIAAAGNAATETDRLARLRALAEPGGPRLPPATPAELATLLPVVAAWAEGRTRAAADLARGRGESHRYLHQFFNNETRAFAPAFPPEPAPASPLHPLWAFYRGRFLTWYMFEHSDVQAVPARKAAFVAEAERCFDQAAAAFPHNPVLAIYAGRNQPAPDLSPWDPQAPAWANHSRRALEQLHRIVTWWIAERQLANGEFGGNWGDDVEMWRWWAPLLLGFDDPALTAAQARLALGNLSRPGLAAGYTSQLTDVEHTAEETADTLTPMLHVAADPAPWAARARRLLELADRTWWGENEKGLLQFRHLDFNHERLGPDPRRAYDTGYHVRVLQPVLLLWQRTGDPALGRPLIRWLRTWAEASLGNDRGKPAGLVPAALHWPSGRIGSEPRGWVGPDLAGDPMQDLYSWPAYPVAAMTAALLQAHVQTGEAIFVAPLLQMARLRRAHLAAGDPDGPGGSVAWAARRLPRVLNDSLAKWRQLTGDDQFDDLLGRDANGYMRYVLARDEAPITAALAATAGALSVNWPLFTDEVRYTDRVLSFPHAWPRAVAGGLGRVDAALLYSSVTGDPGLVDTYPLNGVRWHTPPRDLAVLVAANRREHFSAELFHFGPAPRPLEASFLLLRPGAYRWTLTPSTGGASTTGAFTITAGQRRAAIILPARTRCRLQVDPVR